MLLLRRNRIRVLLLALIAICAAVLPGRSKAEAQGQLYNLYEDNYGSPWCGGGCAGGWCCRITPVYVTSVPENPNFDGL